MKKNLKFLALLDLLPNVFGQVSILKWALFALYQKQLTNGSHVLVSELELYLLANLLWPCHIGTSGPVSGFLQPDK